jgi:hypothetical protein
MTWKMFCQHGHCHIINEFDTSKNWPNWIGDQNFKKKTKIEDQKADF